MPSTTPTAIETAIRNAIDGQSARYAATPAETSGYGRHRYGETFYAGVVRTPPNVEIWKFYEGERRPPGLGRRYYRLEWIPQGPTPDGLMGHGVLEVDVHLHVITDYGSTPMQVVEKMAIDDHFWLRDTISAVRHTLGGWRYFVPLDWDFTEFSREDQYQVDHTFLLRYMQQRV